MRARVWGVTIPDLVNISSLNALHQDTDWTESNCTSIIFDNTVISLL
jgi:hypothetical protein